MGKLARSLRMHGGLPAWTAVSMENALRLVAVIDDAADITGGGQIQDVSGTVKFASGDPVDVEVVIGIGVFRDQYGYQPAVGGGGIDAILSAAAAPLGTFVGGSSGLATAFFKTNSAGRFKVKMTKTSIGAATAWFKAFAVGTVAVDGTSADSVSFDA